MDKSEPPKVFDDLYADFCTNLRTTGKASSFCQSIKSSNSDLSRVGLLMQEYGDIIPGFISSINEFKDKNPKNSPKAKEILEVYYLSKEKFGDNEENLVELLNSALVHIQIDKELETEDFEKLLSISALENLILNQNEIKIAEGPLLREIYRERANYYYNRGEYGISLMDSLRGIFYGQGNENSVSDKIFLLLFLTGASLRNWGLLELATNILQLSIKLLRKSALDNAAKSVETMRVVKLMKEIQQVSSDKENKKSSTASVNFTNLLEPKRKNISKLFEGPSDILIGASSVLQLKWQADRGRHLLAKKTIYPGSTLIIENPYAWVVHPKESLKFCQNCCLEAKNLFPCKRCSSVVFCSKTCRRDFEAIHKYECQLLKILTSSEILGDMALLCYRTVSKTDLQILKSHIQEYTALQEKVQNSDFVSKENDKISEVNLVLGLDSKGKLDSSSYSSVFAQTTNSDTRLSGDLLKRTYCAIYLTLCLRIAGFFKGEAKPKGKEKLEKANESLANTEELVASLFLRHLQSASCNAYGINNISGTDPRRLQIKEIGGATNPIISTTNHSCNNNVYRYTAGKICIVKALREIQAGEEILDSYGPLFASSACEERMRYLDGQYLFSCQCTPCQEDWPVYSKLPREKVCFKCPKCGNDSSPASATSKDKQSCKNCSNIFETKKIMKNVKGSERQFIGAKEKILNLKNDGKCEIDYESVQNSIAQYVNILGKIQKWPCQALVECQEALKLCWNLENRN